MNLLKLKLISCYLLIPLVIICFMLSSCERDFIVEDEVDGLKIETNNENNQKSIETINFNKNLTDWVCEENPRCGFTIPDTSNPPNGPDFNVSCECRDCNRGYYFSKFIECWTKGNSEACREAEEACCNLRITENNCLQHIDDGNPWLPLDAEDCASCKIKFPKGGDDVPPNDGISGGN